ncbi:MAG: NAD(P)(+) transhydrogenase (Re/Si-specific) subunit beta [Flavobacteriia bacterium]|nr:NAD(P)(+) transhydrogenase (Re/Si-specific) subunit beta [Flavobacteriia bacterium]
MTLVLQISYYLSMLSFIVGLKYLSSPLKAKRGNIIAAIGMITAVLATIFSVYLGKSLNLNFILIILAILLGTIIGKRMSDRAEMTKMPQLVSYFNAMGGGCALLLGILEAQQIHQDSRTAEIVLLIAMMIGASSFSGSIIAFLKLSGKQKDKKSIFVMLLSRSILLAMIIVPVLVSFDILNLSLLQEVAILACLACFYGVVFVLPIGGADMPVVISLLNSFTGLATALAGVMFHNIIMIAGGIFVGAAGVLLTLLMCNAMNRSLLSVLAGKFKKSSSYGNSVAKELEIQVTTIGETASKLAFANKVAIIPGYGLAVAQAQHLCNQLEIILENRGVEVEYIIHPVAGRMPGHMNVLLAEADVNYNKLKEMDDVNDEMNSYDVAIVLGANDVVNPAAEQDENSPIFGMPIIKAYNAQNVIVVKRGMSNGYAGVENKLFEYENCTLLFSDAKIALADIINELKSLV